MVGGDDGGGGQPFLDLLTPALLLTICQITIDEHAKELDQLHIYRTYNRHICVIFWIG
jgi:hypothetical protein